MDHVSGRQPIALGDFGVARDAAAEAGALRYQLRPGGPVDGAVHSTTAQQGSVSSVDNGIDRQFGDVPPDDFDLFLHGSLRKKQSLPQRHGDTEEIINPKPEILNRSNKS